jgi:hypothetical protein
MSQPKEKLALGPEAAAGGAVSSSIRSKRLHGAEAAPILVPDFIHIERAAAA